MEERNGATGGLSTTCRGRTGRLPRAVKLSRPSPVHSRGASSDVSVCSAYAAWQWQLELKG